MKRTFDDAICDEPQLRRMRWIASLWTTGLLLCAGSTWWEAWVPTPALAPLAAQAAPSASPATSALPTIAARRTPTTTPTTLPGDPNVRRQ